MINAANKCFGKRGRDTSDSTHSTDTQIDLKPPQVRSEIADSHRSREERLSSKRYFLIKNSKKEVSCPTSSRRYPARKPSQGSIGF